jgi:hypothetical protein
MCDLWEWPGADRAATEIGGSRAQEPSQAKGVGEG